MLAELGRDADLYILDATDRPGETDRAKRNLLTAPRTCGPDTSASGQLAGSGAVACVRFGGWVSLI